MSFFVKYKKQIMSEMEIKPIFANEFIILLLSFLIFITELDKLSSFKKFISQFFLYIVIPFWLMPFGV